MSNQVYLETSIVSYLTARPSRDLMAAAAQQATQEWWEQQRHRFALYISPVVLEEAALGDTKAAEKRTLALQNIPILELTSEVLKLADTLMIQKVLSPKEKQDSVHVAVATVYELNYLLTWNCRHIANAEIQKRMAQASHQLGYELPRICTPYELLGGLTNVE
jgi:predicted nucleic acid-binding protein